MEKTKEQKLASKQRYFNQESKVAEKLVNASNLYEYIDSLKYAYSFCLRYKKNLRNVIGETDPFGVKPQFKKCLKAGILKPWNDTYWFDKEKAESLQQFILENQN